MVSLSGGESLQVFFFIIYCLCWRSTYQEGEGRDTLNQFNSVTFLCLSLARDWISNNICCGLFVFSHLRREVNVHFVGIGGIVDLTV